MAAAWPGAAPVPLEDRTGAPTQQLREGSGAAAAMLTAKDWKQPSPLPWSWEEFASSLYSATSNFLTQNTKLPKPDSAASGDMAERHLAQTGLESKPRVLGFYRDTLPRSTVTRDKLAFPI